MKGDLAEGVLPGVLRMLYVERRTGMLHVTCGEERGGICFMKGNIVYGETNIKECHLGETLVRHGISRRGTSNGPWRYQVHGTLSRAGPRGAWDSRRQRVSRTPWPFMFVSSCSSKRYEPSRQENTVSRSSRT